MRNRLLGIAAAVLAAGATAPAFAHHGDHDEEAAMRCTIADGEGAITALDVADSKLRIAHEPIEQLSWPAMDMEFKADKRVDLSAFGAGDKVHFLLAAQKDRSWRVMAMCGADAEPGAHAACMSAMRKAAAKIAPKEKACATADEAHSGHDAH